VSGEGDLKLESLSKFIVKAPSWAKSLAVIFIFWLALEAMHLFAPQKTDLPLRYFGFFGYILPAIIALAGTPLIVRLCGNKLSFDWAGLIAVIGLGITLILSLIPTILLFRELFPIMFAISLAFIFMFRILLLATVVDYRLSRVFLPALLQSCIAVIIGTGYFGGQFLQISILLHISFGVTALLFIIIIDKPLRKNFKIGPLELANAFLSQLSDGSKKMDEYFRRVGEEVTVPEVSLFFSREGKKEVIFTVPMLHPGPFGEIGGSNLPAILRSLLGQNTFVVHGSSTHDFNPVEDIEITKIANAIEESRTSLTYNKGASMSRRYHHGSVDVLAQAFGDSVLLVATRSPHTTEDLDYSIGFAIMNAGEKYFSHVAFVDAHNCLPGLAAAVSPASFIATEYLRATKKGLAQISTDGQQPFQLGFARSDIPFTREQGFGDMGVFALVIRTGEQTTAYILLDGNNLMAGFRDEMRKRLLAYVDECEVLTTDTHVVNTISGLNMIGEKIALDLFYPYVEEALQNALTDTSPAEAGGTTAWVEGTVIFGSQRISQLAATVTSMVGSMLPVMIILLIFALVTAGFAYTVFS
jgi:putative membrane protein